MATFTVTTDATFGDGSLTQALLDAADNGLHTADTIVFASGMAGFSFDMLQTLELYQDVTIDGDIGNDGDADVTIAGGGIGGHRLFTIGYGYTVTLDSLTLSDGYDSAPGSYYSGYHAASAVINFGTLTITGSVLQNNMAIGGNGGTYGGHGYAGGNAATILNTGNVTITNTAFSANFATGGAGSAGANGRDATASSYVSARPGEEGGTGGHAASVLLQFGQSATLSGLSITGNSAFGGNGGAAGNGGTGDSYYNGSSTYNYDGRDGGNGGAGGSAGAIVIATTATGSVTFATPQIVGAGTGGAYGLGGGAGTATYAGSDGLPGADGRTGGMDAHARKRDENGSEFFEVPLSAGEVLARIASFVAALVVGFVGVAEILLWTGSFLVVGLIGAAASVSLFGASRKWKRAQCQPSAPSLAPCCRRWYSWRPGWPILSGCKPTGVNS